MQTVKQPDNNPSNVYSFSSEWLLFHIYSTFILELSFSSEVFLIWKSPFTIEFLKSIDLE